MTPEQELQVVSVVDQLNEKGCGIPPEAVSALLEFLETITSPQDTEETALD